MKRTLGLDIGTNSVGWAVIDVPDQDDEVGSVLALGSRVFPEGAERSGAALTTKAAERRQKRTMRRQVQRRAKRKSLIRQEFARLGLLPAEPTEFDDLMLLDPAALLERSANGEALTLREIGRVLYWYSTRRGFLSLRTGGSTTLDEDEAEDDKPYRLSQFSTSTGERVVVGQEQQVIEFLKSQSAHHGVLSNDVIFGHRGRLEYPVRPIKRKDFLSRPDASIVEEFGLHGLLFFQRAVYWHESTIGSCSLNPKRGQPRAARAERASQTYKIWKTIVDLRVGVDGMTLTKQQQQRLYDKLSTQKTITFKSLRKVIGLAPDEPINFDDGKKKHLAGHETDTALTKVLGDTYQQMAEFDKDQLVCVLLGQGSSVEVSRQLDKRFGLTDTEAEDALKVRFPTGRSNYSRQTLRTLLKHLPGAETERDAIEAAGFKTPEQARADKPLSLEDITNPLVKTALAQVKKVVQAVANEYGRQDTPELFDAVRIELSRDVRANYRQREETSKRQRLQEKERADAVKQIEEFQPGSGNSRDAQRRLRLLKNQKEACLYSGKPITVQAALNGAQTQIDHILPRARTLNDSFLNVALVYAGENQAKGDRTIYEWGGQAKVDEIVTRAEKKNLPRGLIKNLKLERVLDDTIPSSLLVATGYINAVARDYVKELLNITPEVSRGRLTAHMRYRMGLKKNDDDHRRHGQDAAMVALTTPSIAMSLARRYKQQVAGATVDGDAYGGWEPWPGARDEIQAAYDDAVVSHKPKRKVSGQFVEDTLYGKINDPDNDTLYARRRDLSAGLTRKQMKLVADEAVKQALVADLRRREQDPDAAKVKFDPNAWPTMPDGTEIRSVRCHANLPSNIVLKPDTEPKTSHTPAGNQVGIVFKNRITGKFRIDVITKLDAFRQRQQLPREWGHEGTRPDEDIEFTLSIGEMLQLLDPATSDVRIMVVKKLSSASSNVSLTPANDSTGGSETFSAQKLASSGPISKVIVTPAGLIRTASD